MAHHPTAREGYRRLVSGRDHPRLPEFGRVVTEALGGRGGGAGRQFQGKAEAIHRHPEALERLRLASGELARTGSGSEDLQVR